MRDEKWLSNRLREEWARVHCYTFEACAIPSVPDLYAASKVLSPFWIELKQIPSSGYMIPFRAGQPEWLENHHQRGGRALVMVMVGGTEIWVLKAERLRLLRMKKLNEAEAWLTGVLPLTGPNPWHALESHVLGVSFVAGQRL